MSHAVSNNIFQDSFNKILSRQSTNVSFFLAHNCIKRIELKSMGPKHTHSAMFWKFLRRMTSLYKQYVQCDI